MRVQPVHMFWIVLFYGSFIAVNVCIGFAIASWWYGRSKRQAQRELERWLSQLPKVEGLPPVRHGNPWSQRSWANPNGYGRDDNAYIPTGGFWAPPPKGTYFINHKGPVDVNPADFRGRQP